MNIKARFLFQCFHVASEQQWLVFLLARQIDSSIYMASEIIFIDGEPYTDTAPIKIVLLAVTDIFYWDYL